MFTRLKNNVQKQLIPLEELTAALRLIKKLREEENKNRSPYYISAYIMDERYLERLLEGKIAEHGYTQIEGKFYKNEDLEKIGHRSKEEFHELGTDLYQKTQLALITPLAI